MILESQKSPDSAPGTPRDRLADSPQFIKGVGPKRVALLERLGIQTVRDLLFHFPRKYLNRSEIIPIGETTVGETATICGEVVSRRRKRGRGGNSTLLIRIRDESGELDAAWFNQSYLFDRFAEGQHLVMWGKVNHYDRLQIANPDFEILESEDASTAGFTGCIPIYALTEGLYAKQMRWILANALEMYADEAKEIFVPALRKKKKLPPVAEALRNVHFPSSLEKLEAGLHRFKYEELFLLELGMALRRRSLKAEEKGSCIKISEAVDKRIRRLFPFPFTAAQERAIVEISADLKSDAPMNRLVHGDVGCGKTAVALYAMLAAVANKMQVAFMAPTGILAEQHYKTIQTYLHSARVSATLLTGGLSPKERTDRLNRIATGEIDLVVGTHALVQRDVAFAKLGLVVVDEQHKFGVVQRGSLRDKGLHPDVLVMTATPIPRTLTLSVFGDLDVTIIDEMPAGRKPIETFLADNTDADKRKKTIAFVARKLSEGQQAYFVYPLVEESEASGDLKSATAMAKRLAKGPLGKFGVRLLHGQMKPEEKDRIMAAFREKEFAVLVATLVVEVGLDIPNATVMVIENAERFGLAQLHQLRGRIGRGKVKSSCILLGDTGSEEARERLETMQATSDGFKIAEEDLRMRGPGQFFGTRQHGLPELRFAHLIEDFKLLIRARDDAFRLVKNDPALKKTASKPIQKAVFEKYGKVLELVHVG